MENKRAKFKNQVSEEDMFKMKSIIIISHLAHKYKNEGKLWGVAYKTGDDIKYEFFEKREDANDRRTLINNRTILACVFRVP